MKKHLRAVLAALLCLALAGFGCTTIYKAAVDERGLGTQVNDEKIESVILAKFIGDENIKTLDLTAKCFAGHVYLVGEYESPEQMDRALAIVKEVDGVNSFTPYLLPKKKLASCGTGDNLKIRGAIRRGSSATRRSGPPTSTCAYSSAGPCSWGSWALPEKSRSPSLMLKA